MEVLQHSYFSLYSISYAHTYIHSIIIFYKQGLIWGSTQLSPKLFPVPIAPIPSMVPWRGLAACGLLSQINIIHNGTSFILVGDLLY